VGGSVTARARSAPFYRAVVETIPQMVWTKTAAGVNEFANQRFLAYMNLSIAEFRTNSWIVAHPDDVERGRAAWRRALEAGETYDVELRLRPRDAQTYRWFLVRAVPHRNASGRIVRWCGTTTDIDVHKRYAERQAETVRVFADLFSPDDLPDIPGVRLDAVYVPADDLGRIGGDFYLASRMPDGRVLFAIGDVAGHGLAAAVTMERVRNAVLAAALDASDPAAVLRSVNRLLRVRRIAPFVTAIVGYLDPASGAFDYAAAGHHGPIFAAPDALAVGLPHGGMPLGIEDDPAFPIVSGTLAPGAMLVLYTDGMIETRATRQPTRPGSSKPRPGPHALRARPPLARSRISSSAMPRRRTTSRS
jgi:PAS domain S-box-containing protein